MGMIEARPEVVCGELVDGRRGGCSERLVWEEEAFVVDGCNDIYRRKEIMRFQSPKCFFKYRIYLVCEYVYTFVQLNCVL